MTTRAPAVLAAIAMLTAATPALAAGGSATSAQPAPIAIISDTDQQDTTDLQQQAGQIVVVATRIKGQVEAPQAPVLELDEEDVAAYGATSIADLLAQLAPETSSGRDRGSGPPVILLNGQRIASFRELRDFPPEAIRRVEVLPEEVSLRYGYAPNQRVVNFILKDKFRSASIGFEYGQPTQGGFATTESEASLSRIDGPTRLNLKAKLKTTSPLTQAERGIATPAASQPDVAGDPDPAAWTTLIARDSTASLNANWSKAIGKNGGSLSLNGALTREYSRGLNGLDSVVLTAPGGSSARRTTLLPQPLTSRTRTLTAQTGASLNMPVGTWQLSATADYTHTDVSSTIDRPADLSGLQALAAAGTLGIAAPLPASAIVAQTPDSAQSNTDSVSSLLTLTGRPFRMPAGATSLTLKAGYAWSDITSSDTRTGLGRLHLARGEAQAGGNIALPITSRREAFGGALGDITLNANASVHRLSDFGTLANYGAGATWGLTPSLTLQASYIGEDKAPGLTDLGNPVTVTPGVAVYDFSTGQTVLATVTTGGNPNLTKERQRDWKFSATWDLPLFERSNLLVEYFRNHSTGTTNAFPLLTPQVEAAYPGRVTRDPATGQIVAVDERAVTFADERSTSLRYGVNLGGSFGKPDPSAMRRRFGGGRPGGRDGARRGGRGGPPPGGARARGGKGRRFGDGRGRWNLSIYHTVKFSEQAQLTAGGPVLDLLGGDAITGGGAVRHSVTMEGGGFYRGFGLRLSGTYTGGSYIDSSGLPGSTRLDFAPVATVDMRLFMVFERMPRLLEKAPFLKGSRLLIKVENLFDAQQKVTDGTGAVPLRYQPGFEDPRGRVVSIDFRKRF